MNFSQSFRLAIKSLMTSKMRALLTMLGIIIGVAAVIVITSLGNGMQNMMNAEFESLGANLIQVQAWGRGGGSRSVDPDDMYALVDKYPQYLAGVSPYVGTNVTVRNGADKYERTSIYGVSEFFYDAVRNQALSGETLAEGRFLAYIDVARVQNVCVVGSYLAQEAFGGDALGKTLTLDGVPFTIVGVLQERGDSTQGSGDDLMFIPYQNALRLSGSSTVYDYLFNSTGGDTVTAAKAIIENRLFKTFQDENAYFVVSSKEMMEAMNTMLTAMMMVLVAIAAISLLVGGIGIMNIMLVSVTERTREIGVRKSLGAKRRDIRGQFIIEAGTTSAIGGILGIGIGVGLANVAGMLISGMMSTGLGGAGTFTASATVGSVAIAFGVSVSIGVLFGYLPANKAAKLNPIDALRYD
jgi:putative ABC transport system permease protein